MLLGRQLADHLLRREVDDGDRRPIPQAHEKTLPLGVDDAGVGIAILAQRHEDAILRPIQRQDADRVAKDASRTQRLAGGIEREAGGDKLRVGQLDLPWPGQEAVGDIERMDRVELAAAGKERLAVGRKGEALERLRQRHPAADARLAAHFDDLDFVRAVAGVQGRQPFTVGMQREVDGKVAQLDLRTGRPNRPAVGQADRAIELRPGRRTAALAGSPASARFSVSSNKATAA